MYRRDMPDRTDPCALAHVEDAQKALSRLTHPSLAGRYPDATRAVLAPALVDALEAVARVGRVLDTTPGACR